MMLKFGNSLQMTFGWYSLNKGSSFSSSCPKCQNSFKSDLLCPFAVSFPKLCSVAEESDYFLTSFHFLFLGKNNLEALALLKR